MSAIPNAVLLTVAIIACTATNLLQGVFAKNTEMTGRRLWFFNAVQSGICLIGITLVESLTGADFTFSGYSVLMGAGFGLTVVISVLAALKAKSVGPFNYTCVIVALSSIIPTLSGRVFFNDTVHPMQYVGVVLMIVCILLSPEKVSGDNQKANFVWLVCCGVAFLAEGGIGVWQKFHQESPHAAEMPALLIVGFAVSAAFSFLMYLRESDKTRTDGDNRPFTKKEWITSVIAGLTLCFPHTINLYLVGVLPTVLFFPLVNLCPMMLTMILAVVLFREKLSVKRWIGVGVGVLSTVFVGGMLNSLI